MFHLNVHIVYVYRKMLKFSYFFPPWRFLMWNCVVHTKHIQFIPFNSSLSISHILSWQFAFLQIIYVIPIAATHTPTGTPTTSSLYIILLCVLHISQFPRIHRVEKKEYYNLHALAGCDVRFCCWIGYMFVCMCMYRKYYVM